MESDDKTARPAEVSTRPECGYFLASRRTSEYFNIILQKEEASSKLSLVGVIMRLLPQRHLNVVNVVDDLIDGCTVFQGVVERYVKPIRTQFILICGTCKEI